MSDFDDWWSTYGNDSSEAKEIASHLYSELKHENDNLRRMIDLGLHWDDLSNHPDDHPIPH